MFAFASKHECQQFSVLNRIYIHWLVTCDICWHRLVIDSLDDQTVDGQTGHNACYDTTEYYPNDPTLVRVMQPEHRTECQAFAWTFCTSAICVLCDCAFVTAAARFGILAIRFQTTAIFRTIYIVVAVGVLLTGRTLKPSKSYLAIS